jgi:hypothetical protein
MPSVSFKSDERSSAPDAAAFARAAVLEALARGAFVPVREALARGAFVPVREVLARGAFVPVREVATIRRACRGGP